jgi:hypothetical protein
MVEFWLLFRFLANSDCVRILLYKYWKINVELKYMFNQFWQGILGAFNNPSDPKSWLYYLGFVFVAVIINLITSFIWSKFPKNDNSSSKMSQSSGHHSTSIMSGRDSFVSKK